MYSYKCTFLVFPYLLIQIVFLSISTSEFSKRELKVTVQILKFFHTFWIDKS